MDPTATMLALLRLFMTSSNPYTRNLAIEHLQNLTEWFEKGGHFPNIESLYEELNRTIG